MATERGERRKDILLACVFGKNLLDEECYFIKNTLENVAAFIVQDQRDKMLLDENNDFILDTFGSFINKCPNKIYLEELKKVLIQIQMGEVEPQEIERVEI